MIAEKEAAGYRKGFPLLQRKINGKRIIYLDNAATTQKPGTVIESIRRYYSTSNANVHRGVYALSQEASQQYEAAHQAVGKFINASPEEVIFTRGTTESINALAYTLEIPRGSDIVLTEMEHHSNLVPWQQCAKRNSCSLKFIRMKDDFTLDYADAEKKITNKACVVSLAHVSNALGTGNDVKKIVSMAKKHRAITIVDAAQSVPHMPVDVKELGCDFLAFSGHKMCGPTGIGVLFGKRELLESLSPFQFGGDMIRKVKYQDATWNGLPMKFEAGTPNIEGAIGLKAAIGYLQEIGMSNIEQWEKELCSYAREKLGKIEGVELYAPPPKQGTGILSFNVEGIHGHDVASILDTGNMCIRAGHHCAMPLMEKLGIAGTCRASFYLYNTHEDVDYLVQGVKKVKRVFMR